MLRVIALEELAIRRRDSSTRTISAETKTP